MLFRLFLLTLATLAASAQAFAAGQAQTWQVDGGARTGLVFAPDSAGAEPAPLVFVFHGHGGTARRSSNQFKIQELWPEAIVIYPQGLNTPGRLTDPDGLKPGWQAHVGDQNDRDLKLFDALLKWAHQTYKVDDKRIYCTGHSNGAAFTYLLWGARGDTFAAVAAACAPAITPIQEMKAKPAMHIGSPDDPIVNFDWQQKTIDAIRKLNACDAEGKPDGDRITLYPSASGTPLETYIYPGGHTPPPEAWPEVVKFFKAHPGK